MNEWATLVKTAVIGTGRGVAPITGGRSPLSRLLVAAQTDSAEQTLLRQAGLIAQYEQIGQLPQRADPPHPTQHAYCSTQQHPLTLMLASRYKELLPTYLALLAEAEQSITARYLPNLLDYGATASHQAHAVVAVLGEHGRWLADQNPAWAYASTSAESWEGANRIWRNPKLQRRQALLRQLRHRQPQLGRELLASTWKSEIPAARLSMIRLLEIGLSSADESFLDAARSDRNNSVRREAIRLLCRLTDSKLMQRMTRATQNVLRWDAQSNQLVVRFPMTITRSLAQDGVPIQLAAKKNNKAILRAAQLSAMLHGVPLNVWSGRLGVSAETLINAIPNTNWPRTLTAAWIQAAQNQRNTEWSRLLLAQLGITRTNVKLVSILTPADQDTLATKLFETERNAPFTRGSQLPRLFVNLKGDWSPTCSHLFLTMFASYLSADPNRPVTHTIDNCLRRFARNCPPNLFNKASDTLSSLNGSNAWRNKIQTAINVISFRSDMIRSITSDQ